MGVLGFAGGDGGVRAEKSGQMNKKQTIINAVTRTIWC